MVKNFDETAIKGLENVSSSPFERISYTKAVELLKNVRQEVSRIRYLTETIFKKPVIVYNYSKRIKAFYMRLNYDEKTVAAMDVLVPKFGELIGGSQREEQLDVPTRRSGGWWRAPTSDVRLYVWGWNKIKWNDGRWEWEDTPCREDGHRHSVSWRC